MIVPMKCTKDDFNTIWHLTFETFMNILFHMIKNGTFEM